jgi:hypothetical protein
MTDAPAVQQKAPIDLALSSGGPIFSLLRVLRIRPYPPPAMRAAAALAAVTWLPLLIFSVAKHLAVTDRVTISFVKDISVYARFLVAIPLLIVAGQFIDGRLSAAISRLVESGIIPANRQSEFDREYKRLRRGCELWLPDIVMLAIVATYAWLDVTRGVRGATTNWATGLESTGLTPAGWWYSVVSLPVFGLLSLRWVWRMFLWTRFLRRVTGLGLELIPTHPDRVGGLGALTEATIGFDVVVAAYSVTLGSTVAMRMLYSGESLSNSKLVIAAFVVVAVLLFLGPLLVFTPVLTRARFLGLLTYGDLAEDYVRAFDRKWLKQALRAEPDGDRVQKSGEALLGSSDVQSLADIGGSYERVAEMKTTLITPRLMVLLVLSALLPMLPPLSAVIPVVQILEKLLSMMAK